MQGIPADRVVAVVAESASGGAVAFGTGYLLDTTRVLTARHCVIDRETRQPAARLRVAWSQDGCAVPAVVGAEAPDLDVALLAVIATPPWGSGLPGGPVRFGMLDRDHSGQLEGCEAVGFPRWQAGEDGGREIAEVHGPVRVLEGRERQRLVLRDPVLSGVAAVGGPTWAGFSGAAVFHGGLLLGVVIEHHARQGETALQIRPVMAVAASAEPATRRLAEALGLGQDNAFQQVTAGPVYPQSAMPGRWWAEEAGEAALAQWGWSLEHDPEGVRHWRPRARGVGIDSEQGWRFRGRAAALTEIVSWLDREVPDRRVLVVTGSPGAGKSAVLGRIVTTADSAARTALPPDDAAVRASVGSVHCAVHAKGKTALEVAAEIARAAPTKVPERIEDFVPALRDALHEPGRQPGRFNVIIDALDEAASPDQARVIVRDVILPLAVTLADDGVQVVAGTRRADGGGDLLGAFGDGRRLVDLDEPVFFASGDLAAYALACLRLAGDERAGNPYSDEAAAGPVAARIAELSERNFLVAGLTARSHGLFDPVPAAPAELSFASTVEAALHEYLARVPVPAAVAEDAPGATVASLLTALAFAEAPGFTAGLWRTALEALGAGEVAERALTVFARSSAASFLVESSGAGGDETAFRLFHQALGDALLSARARVIDRADDERTLADALTWAGRDAGWENAPAYLLRSLPGHAARAGTMDALLAEDGYLLHADLRRLIQAAGNVSSPGGRRRVRLLRLTPEGITAPPDERAALFSVTEALENLGTAYRNGHWAASYRARWATTLPRLERIVCTGHRLDVWAVCALEVDAQGLLATASQDRTVRVWDPRTGQQLRLIEGTQGGWFISVCAVMVDGRPLLAAGSSDGSVQIWDPRTGQQHQAWKLAHGGVTAMCAVMVDGRPLLAAGSSDGSVQIWDPRTGQQHQAWKLAHGRVTAMCAVMVDGETFLAFGHGDGGDGSVGVWNLSTGQQHLRLEGRHNKVNAVCAVGVDGKTLLATAGREGLVRIWDLRTGQQHQVLTGHMTDAAGAVCAVTVDGESLLASGHDDGSVRVWNPRTGQQHVVLNGHQGQILAACAMEVDGQVLLATGSGDRTARIWNPSDIEQIDVPQAQHNSFVQSVCAVTVDGESLLASGHDDGSVRVWDPHTGKQQQELKSQSGYRVDAMCAVTVGRRSLLAAAGRDGTVRIWDLRTGKQHRTLKSSRTAVTAVCAVMVGSRTFLATGDDEGSVRVWDPRTGKQQQVLEGHRPKYKVDAVCAVAVDGQILLATASSDESVRVWDPHTGQQHYVIEWAYHDFAGVCAVRVDGEALLASGGRQTVLVWEPRTGQRRWLLEGHQGLVTSVCAVTVEGRPLLATASEDRTVRLWDPRTGNCEAIIPTHYGPQAVTDVACSLAIGTDAGILMIRPGAAR